MAWRDTVRLQPGLRQGFLEKKVQTKDEVLAELMAEHVALKKVLGSFEQDLGVA